jgi:hypothetical protein
MPVYSSQARRDEYDYLKVLRQQRIITSAVFQQKKANIDKREQKAIQTAEASRIRKEQERVRKAREVVQKREAKKQQTLRKKATFKMLDNSLKGGRTFSARLRTLDESVGLLEFIRKLNTINKKLLLRVGDTTFVLSDATRQRLLDAITATMVDEESTELISGMAIVHEWQRLEIDDIVEVSEFVPTNRNRRVAGAFFQYTHNTIFDLTRYGLYKTGEPQDHTNNCLINALIISDVKPEALEAVKLIVKNRIIPQTKLKEIAIKADICIKLKRIHDKHPHTMYGDKSKPIIEIGIIDDHYFLVEKTKITSFCINNYDEVKDLEDCNNIYKKTGSYYRRSETHYVDSFDIVKALLNNRATLLTEMTMEDRMMASSQFYDKVSSEIKSLEFDATVCVRPVVKDKKKGDDIEYENVVFDFETDPNGTHTPYLVRTYGNNINNVFTGSNCGLQMLCSLRRNTRLIAHNASYDYRFLIDHLWDIQELARGTRLISLKAKFGSPKTFINIQIKDSYKLITEPLRNFPSMFGLESEKEVMPYSIYTQANIEKRYLNIQEVLQVIKEEDKKQFLNNITRWDLQKGDDYDIIEYSSRYCEIDCKILWEGYNIFRKWMIDCVNIDIDEKLTIASLAHTYFINEGCYDEVNELGGVPQMFIQGAVVGGRTMCARNEKITLTEKVNDFDAVSLYPSAMSRMSGFLKGIPKIITNLSYDWLQKQDGYFVDILIKGVGIHRAFPLMSYKNEGVRLFSNDMIGKTIRVDKTTLEDLVEFQNVSFDIVRGYYFDEGFNTKVISTIKYLFNERLIKKKADNPAQVIYKLIMNASYGKSIMKAVEDETRFFDNVDEFNVYLSRNYNWAKSFVRFGQGKTKLTSVKALSDHYNIAHVGVCILSMSKRIMNEVMALAEDKELELYYQDTDSIHIKDCDIKTLSDAFTSKYNRQLIGKAMGQFHSDFDLKGCSNVYAKRSIFLGKKSYIDELVGTDKDGNEKIGYHIRMKGIPESCMYHTATKNGYNNVFDMYEALLKGKKITADLTEGGIKANFKFNTDYSCHTLSVFKRTMAF